MIKKDNVRIFRTLFRKLIINNMGYNIYILENPNHLYDSRNIIIVQLVSPCFLLLFILFCNLLHNISIVYLFSITYLFIYHFNKSIIFDTHPRNFCTRVVVFSICLFVFSICLCFVLIINYCLQRKIF